MDLCIYKIPKFLSKRISVKTISWFFIFSSNIPSVKLNPLASFINLERKSSKNIEIFEELNSIYNELNNYPCNNN